ncbi:S8/S53 family peptidase [Algoriphagus sp. D3-2-R+10]|uniref:S8 family peptidase n=1 Tax=Algoriphagus aurantiacus TaxID=3103948 RepID=UPI002B3C0152|nr:S8/S53 family peptidase [Algoriphagus sp. D3-2-R+10]MEB2775528.1 S8/S53 family peptidase [Algoriphagus sp. D3-2-R+10]
MKKLVYLLVIGYILFSCASEGTKGISVTTLYSPNEQELYNVELIFEESSGYIPLKNNPNCIGGLDGEACQSDAKKLKSEINQEIKQIDESIQVYEKYISVSLDVSVYLGGLTEAQFKNLEVNAVSHHFLMSRPIDIQARRPIMQTDYIQHARRPIMQEQLRYDSLTKTSLMIKEIGGGLPGSSNPTHRVWIVDSGIDSEHQDLNFDSIEADLSSDFSAGSSNDPFEDIYGHGTFLAGVIGGLASTNPIYSQGYGVNGVFPGAKMVSIKIFNGNGKTNSAIVRFALTHIYDHASAGDVVNLSWGLRITLGDCNAPQYKKMYELIDLLASKGVYVVMSAGNEPTVSLTNFPGCIDLESSPPSVKSKIFTIGSIEVRNPGEYYYSSFSNYGLPSIDYLAPGEYVFTTAPGGTYVLVSGTSLSAAIFSGILYHSTNVGTLASIRRGPDAEGDDPLYPIAKVGD